MTLYEMIIFLKGHMRDKLWCVENVVPYYEPLIEPTTNIDRHLYWSNFDIPKIDIEKEYVIKYVKIETLEDFDISKYRGISNKRQVIRNQVNYNVGEHILKCAEATYSKGEINA